jgi:hypothetical protein
MAVDSCIAIKQYLHNALNNVQRGLIWRTVSCQRRHRVQIPQNLFPVCSPQ